jgi:hypothetical protein
LNFRHGIRVLIGFRVKISGAAKYVALQQKAGYSGSNSGRRFVAAGERK